MDLIEILCESVWIWHENGWLKFKYIGIFETLIFDGKKNWYLLFEMKIFDPWTALIFLIGLWAHSQLLKNFQVPLVRARNDG